MATATLKAVLGLDQSGFEAGIQTATAKTEHFAGEMKRAIGEAALEIGASLAAAFTVDKIIEGTKAVVELGAHLQETSLRTGASVKSLALLSEAYKKAGLDSSGLGQNINKLQKSIAEAEKGTGEGAKAFQELGLNVNYIKSLSADEQFKAIGAALQRVYDPAQKAALAIALFGRSGGELLQLFNDPKAFGEASETLGKQADLLQENSKKFKEISDLLGAVGTKVQGFFLGIASSLSEQIIPALQGFNKLDFTGLGEQFGKAFTDPQAFEVLLTKLQKIMDIVFSPKVLEAFFNDLVAGFGLLGAVMIRTFEKPLKFLSDGLQFVFDNIAPAWAALLLKPFGLVADELDKLFGTKLGDQVASGTKNLIDGVFGKQPSFQEIQKQNADKDPFGLNVNQGVQNAFDTFADSSKIISPAFQQALGIAGVNGQGAAGGAAGSGIPGLTDALGGGAAGAGNTPNGLPSAPDVTGGQANGGSDGGKNKAIEILSQMLTVLQGIQTKIGDAVVA